MEKRSINTDFDDSDDEDVVDEYAINFASNTDDIRHGHKMCDIFNSGGKHVSLTDRFTGVLDDILFLMNFSSPTISDFFDDVTECLIKRSVRQFMKLLTAYWCVILIKSMRNSEESMTKCKFTISMFFALVAIYLTTFRQLSRREYKLISMGAMVGTLTYTIYESADKNSSIDGSFAYPFGLIFLLLIFLPLTIRVVTPSIILFCFTFLLVSSRKMAYTHLISLINFDQLFLMDEAGSQCLRCIPIRSNFRSNTRSATKIPMH